MDTSGATKRTRWLWRVGGLALATAAMTAVYSCSDRPTAPRVPEMPRPEFAFSKAGNGPGECLLKNTQDAGYINNVTSLNCTSNDVSISQANITYYKINGSKNDVNNGGLGTYSQLVSPNRISCIPGDSIFAVTSALIQNSASERYDLGLWINTGTPPDTSAYNGSSCFHFNLIPGQGGSTEIDQTPDACGDMTSGILATIPLDTLTLVCPSGGATTVPIGACAAWSNGTTGSNDRICPAPSAFPDTALGFRWGTTPGTTAKCRCEPLLLPIDVKGVLRVTKVTVPSPDTTHFSFTPGSWNSNTAFLLQDGQTKVSDPISAGTYTVAETPRTGWTLGTPACVVTGTATAADFTTITNGVSVNLASGQDVTCTFTNTATASLAVQKATSGGTASFNYTVTGTGLSAFSRNTATQGNPTTQPAFPFTGTQISDTKYVTESSLAGWTITNIACTANGATIAIGTGQGASFDQGTSAGYDQGDNTIQVVLKAGSSPTCTFTNTKSATLEVEKSTTGGTASFDYTVNGSGLVAFSRNTATSNPTVTTPFGFDGTQLGDKYVTETALAGWTLTNIACTANGATIAIGTGQGGSFSQGSTAGYDQGDNTIKVTIHAGDTPVCTFTNTKNASLEVEKSTVGGTASFDYTVDGSGLAAFSRNTGTQGNPTSTTAFPFDGTQLGDKYVTETALAGWTLTNISCTANGATIAIGTGQGAGFSQGATAGYDQGDNTIKVTVGSGNTPVCTFTNTKNASLEVEKSTVGGTASFDYTVSGSGLAAFSRNTATQGNPTSTTAFPFDGTQLGDKYVSETALAGWTLTNIQCTANGATIAIGTGQGGSFSQGATAGYDQGDNTVKVTVAAGSTPTCTFTNTKNASLAIQKSTVGGTASFNYTVSGSGLSAFSRNTATQGNPTTEAAFPLTGIQLGDKYVTETALAGWTITNIACTANGATIAIGTGQGGSFDQGTSAGYDQGDNTVKVTVHAGDSPTCTFTNTKTATLNIEKSTVGGTASFNYTVDGSGLSAFSRNTATQGNPTNTSGFPFDGTQLGDKYVTESALTGWTLTNIACTANGATIAIGSGVGASFSQGATAGYDPGDSTVKVTVHAGDTPTCTFTNTKDGSLSIQKHTLGGTASFDYTGTGSGVPASFSRNTGTQGNPTTEPAFAILGSQLGDKYVQETVTSGYALTNITCTANGATIVIGRGGSGAFTDGGTSGFDAGDNTVKVTVGAGNTPTCTFENTKYGSITIVKDDQNPDTDPQSFSYTGTGTGLSNFSLADDGTVGDNTKVFSDLLPGSRSVAETSINSAWVLTNIACVGATSSTVAFVGANADPAFQGGDNQANIGLAAGENLTCTFTNQRKAELIVTKTVVGGGTQSFDFSRTGISNFSLTNGGSNDSGYSLSPGNYTVCELTLAVAWAATVTVNGNPGTLVNPDLPQDLGNRCITVALGYGDVTTVAWTNTPPPGGNARTIGYWKNWSSCATSNGNQYQKALQNGDWDRTLDGNLPQTIGDLVLAGAPAPNQPSPSCSDAVSILDKSDINNGKKMASDACYNLAAQLLAAKLNYTAGADQCQAATDAIAAGQALLVKYNFDGSGACLSSKGKVSPEVAADITLANSLASTLDSYNNNTLCSP